MSVEAPQSKPSKIAVKAASVPPREGGLFGAVRRAFTESPIVEGKDPVVLEVSLQQPKTSEARPDDSTEKQLERLAGVYALSPLMVGGGRILETKVPFTRWSLLPSGPKEAWELMGKQALPWQNRALDVMDRAQEVLTNPFGLRRAGWRTISSLFKRGRGEFTSILESHQQNSGPEFPVTEDERDLAIAFSAQRSLSSEEEARHWLIEERLKAERGIVDWVGTIAIEGDEFRLLQQVISSDKLPLINIDVIRTIAASILRAKIKSLERILGAQEIFISPADGKVKAFQAGQVSEIGTPEEILTQIDIPDSVQTISGRLNPDLEFALGKWGRFWNRLAWGKRTREHRTAPVGELNVGVKGRESHFSTSVPDTQVAVELIKSGIHVYLKLRQRMKDTHKSDFLRRNRGHFYTIVQARINDVVPREEVVIRLADTKGGKVIPSQETAIQPVASVSEAITTDQYLQAAQVIQGQMQLLDSVRREDVVRTYARSNKPEDLVDAYQRLALMVGEMIETSWKIVEEYKKQQNKV